MNSNGKSNGKPEGSILSTFARFRADYDMDKVTRFVRRRLGLAPQGGTEDYHSKNEYKYYEGLEKARDMVRNDAIIGQIIDRSVANIVQQGFSVDPQTGDASVNQDLKARWEEWANDPDQCDASGEFTFHDLEHRVMRSSIIDGDIFALTANTGHLQIFEGHVIQTTSRVDNTFLGVTLNELRQRQAFHLRKDPETPLQRTKLASEAMDARDKDGNRQILQIYNPKRVSMTRGRTALAPIFSTAGMYEDINFAALVQRQALSCFTFIRNQPPTPTDGSALPSVDGYGESTTETTTAGTRYIEGLSPAMELITNPGETVEGFSPDIPGGQFFEHARLTLQTISAALGVPLVVVLMDGSETNFSGWRGALDEARKGWKCEQHNLEKRFHCPVWKWKVRQWISEDSALKAVSKTTNLFNHKWNAPTWDYIQPKEDAEGDTLKLQGALTSYRRLHGEHGRVWQEVYTEYIEDTMGAIVAAKLAAESINARFPNDQPVIWRELISLPMPTGLQMTMQDPGLIEAQTAGNPNE